MQGQGATWSLHSDRHGGKGGRQALHKRDSVHCRNVVQGGSCDLESGCTQMCVHVPAAAEWAHVL
jgi:hypothetical protein